MLRMNRRQRLLAAWVAASLCWIGYWCWHDVSTCRLLRLHSGWAVACRWQVMQPGGPMVMERTAPALPVLWHMLAQAIVLPLGLLIVGVVIQWVIDATRAGRT
jgi:hypothetical protein